MQTIRKRTGIAFCLALLLSTALLTSAWSKPTTQTTPGISWSLNQIDDSNFPDVVAYATLSDASGLPIAGVPTDTFAAAEDGRPIADLTVQPVVNDQRSVALVLAIDVSGSMRGAPLEATKAAAKSLIEGLGPQDTVAILAFGETTQWLQDFTSDRTKLLGALDALTAAGNTALNEALHESAGRIAALPPGRRAILLLTDGEDTSSTITHEQSLSKAQASGAPVYTIGFGPRIQPDLLQQMARLTGGQYFDAPAPADLQSRFQRVLDQLKQQYVFSYRSEIAPDMREHELLVRVTYAQDVLEDSRRFLARAVTPVTTVSGLEPGATVRGEVRIEPAIVSSDPISQVLYLLDGQPLATADAEPYALDWDTAAVTPGPHELSLQATDRTGKQGAWSAQVVVAPPLEIRFRSPLDSERIGGEVTLAVDWEAAYDLAEVSYWLDDRPLGTVTAPPFQMTWRSTEASDGAHRLTARAKDAIGNQAEAVATIDVAPPVTVHLAAPQPGAIVSGAVPIVAEVEALHGLARVEFWVDGEKVAAQNAAPFQVSWDAHSARMGEHTLLVRATDLTGESDEAQAIVSVPMVDQKLAQPWIWALILGALLFAGVVALLARRRIRRRPLTASDFTGDGSHSRTQDGAACLIWHDLEGGEQRFALAPGENRLGRAADGNQVVIPRPTVSRSHALITVHDDQVTLQNLSSRSISTVNGREIAASRLLHAGDVIEIGDERLTFMIQEEKR